MLPAVLKYYFCRLNFKILVVVEDGVEKNNGKLAQKVDGISKI